MSPADTDPGLIADLGRALARVDDVVWLGTETDLILIGHQDPAVAHLTQRPYEPGVLRAYAHTVGVTGDEQ